MKIFNDISKQLIKEIISDKGVALYNLIWNKKNVSEFKIAEELKLTINQIRNILYQFSTYNLVCSTRRKDREKGWYIYYWTINLNELRLLLVQRKKANLERLREELDTEKDNKFYICSRDGTKLELEEAMEQNFKCQECESVLVHSNNQKRIESINAEIEETRTDLDNLMNDTFVQDAIAQQVEEKIPEEEVTRHKRRKLKKVSKKHKKKKKHKKNSMNTIQML